MQVSKEGIERLKGANDLAAVLAERGIEVKLLDHTTDPIRSLYMAYRVAYSALTPAQIYERIDSNSSALWGRQVPQRGRQHRTNLPLRC